MPQVNEFITSPTNTIIPYTFPANLVGTVVFECLGAGGQGDSIGDLGMGGGGGGYAQTQAYAATPGQTVYLYIDPDNGFSTGNGFTVVSTSPSVSGGYICGANSGTDGADGGGGGGGFAGDLLAAGGNGGAGSTDQSHGGGGGSAAGFAGGEAVPGNNGTDGTTTANGVGGASVAVHAGAGGNFNMDGGLYGGGGGSGPGTPLPNGKQGYISISYNTSSATGSDNGLLMRKVGK